MVTVCLYGPIPDGATLPVRLKNLYRHCLPRPASLRLRVKPVLRRRTPHNPK